MQLYEEFKASHTGHSLTCPVCGSRGNCVVHGSYRRNMIDLVFGRVVYSTVEIERVRCTSCGHTHALLPDLIIPYTTCSLLFILRVLSAYFRHRPVEHICRRFSITPSVLYRWKELFLAHKDIWLGVLRSAETAPEHFCRWLFHVPSYTDRFDALFFSKTARSFLQRHKDAAHSRSAVF